MGNCIVVIYCNYTRLLSREVFFRIAAYTINRWENDNMATINDIAKMAGVSTSTVSHVVNKTRYVSPEKVEKVEKAIRELDTPPNFVLKKTLPHMPEIKEKYILMLIADKKSSFQRRVESAD